MEKKLSDDTETAVAAALKAMAEDPVTAAAGDGHLTIKTDATLADDLLRGVPAIAAFMGDSERRTYYALETKQLPGGKLRGMWIASKRKLRERIEQIVSGGA